MYFWSLFEGTGDVDPLGRVVDEERDGRRNGRAPLGEA